MTENDNQSAELTRIEETLRQYSGAPPSGTLLPALVAWMKLVEANQHLMSKMLEELTSARSKPVDPSSLETPAALWWVDRAQTGEPKRPPMVSG